MKDFLPEGNCDSRTKADLVVTLVWKQSTGVELLPALVSDPQKRPLVGEVNIGRYLAQHQPPGSGATGLDGSLSAQKTLKVCSLSPFGRKLVNDENYWVKYHKFKCLISENSNKSSKHRSRAAFRGEICLPPIEFAIMLKGTLRAT